MVIAPEHPLIQKYADKISNLDEINEYKTNAKKKTEFERVQLAKEKTGVRLKGINCINPVNGKIVPIWVADYVMMGYGTGAIMAVPAHDTRDYEFAKKFGIDIVQVIKPIDENANVDINVEPYTDIYSGKMINSDFLNEMPVKVAIEEMIVHVEKENIGQSKTNYFMKDWAFARQRYWGEPVPIIKCEKCGLVPVPENELPLKLPDLTDFKPGQNGESPLATAEEWKNTICPCCGNHAVRETDTMPQWAGSSWYFLRYIDPKNDACLANMDELKYWLPVDWYNGGMEHVTRHLIYSRFWHHFLYDIGVVPTEEPYAKRSAQGLILGVDGEKMSKSRGNVIDPKDIIDEYGSDTLRTYILFIGEYDESAPWNENGVKGAKKFLDRVMRMDTMLVNNYNKSKSEMDMEINKLIKKVSSDYENMKFNTAIAAFMTYTNMVYKVGEISKEDFKRFLVLLQPVAPHVVQELWSKHFGDKFIELEETWPKYDESKMVQNTVEVPVQINGVVRYKISYSANSTKEEIEAIALKDEKLEQYTNGKQIKKIIVVPGRIVNIVI
jgi:leucyl-tRNA synthetase